LGDLGVDGRRVLKSILRKYGVREWIGFIWCETVSSDWAWEHGNEIWVPKREEIS